MAKTKTTNKKRYIVKLYLYKKNGKPGFNTRSIEVYDVDNKKARRKARKENGGESAVFKMECYHRELAI